MTQDYHPTLLLVTMKLKADIDRNYERFLYETNYAASYYKCQLLNAFENACFMLTEIEERHLYIGSIISDLSVYIADRYACFDLWLEKNGDMEDCMSQSDNFEHLKSFIASPNGERIRKIKEKLRNTLIAEDKYKGDMA
jgi:hypothetical protein